MGNQDLIEIAGKVSDVDSSDVVAKFGIQLLIRMYRGFEFEILDISSGAAGRQVFTGTNLPFDIVHPQSRGSNCKSSSRFVHSMT
jgi:hypothetical protein